VRDLKLWLKKVGLPFHSPHKFRHGNAVYVLKLAKDIAALKAVSQNLMHSNLSITDGVYGILSDTDIQKQIASLGNTGVSGEKKEELEILIRQIIQKAISAQ
jgi:site-specific recombinase XerC